MEKFLCVRECFVGGRLVEKGQIVELKGAPGAAERAVYLDEGLFAPLEKGAREVVAERVVAAEGKSGVRQALEALAARHGIRITANMKDETIRERLKDKGIEVQ